MVEVNSAGDMVVQERRGPTKTDIHRSTLHLNAEQINSLQSVFKGWKRLKHNYPGDWATLVQITYDGYQVEVHDLIQSPTQFTDAMATIVKLARVAVAASTQPAATPETPPAAPAPAAPYTPMPPANLVPRN